MKNIYLLFILICTGLSAIAATSIATPNVAGHWTLAGSPYMVYNNINVSGSTSLTIDPGVEVVFYGAYRLTVSGILNAGGTAAQPINFHVFDTTGWSTDLVTAAGGWHGIQFQTYSGTSVDTSVLNYCNISYTKFDSLDWFATPSIATIYTQRTLLIKNCTFFNNKVNIHCALPLLTVMTYPGVTCEIASCEFYNNVFIDEIVMNYNNYGGNSWFHDNKFHDNTADDIMFCGYSELLFENNELYNNNGAPLFIEGNHGTIRGNKFHDNFNPRVGAIYCVGGVMDIVGNLICNNQESLSACGAIEGGGGISLASNGALPVDSTFYLVRNNVIANNYSAFHGGGINIYGAKATITNNQVINNSSHIGAGIYINEDSETVVVKNNIFYGNTNDGLTAATSPNISGLPAGNFNIQYENNWSEHTTIFDLDIIGSTAAITIIGDTTTNVRGTDPGLVAPTLTASVTEIALSANFGITPASQCINRGDTSGASPYAFDYAGNPRIMGSTIDIGAYEFSATTNTTNPVNNSSLAVYPNPSTGSFTISMRSLITEELHITVSNVVGEKLAEYTTTTNSLSPIHLNVPTGVYILNAATAHEKRSEKIIVVNDK